MRLRRVLAYVKGDDELANAMGPLLAAAPALKEALEACIAIIESKEVERVCHIAQIHGMGFNRAESLKNEATIKVARVALAACRGA